MAVAIGAGVLLHGGPVSGPDASAPVLVRTVALTSQDGAGDEQSEADTAGSASDEEAAASSGDSEGEGSSAGGSGASGSMEQDSAPTTTAEQAETPSAPESDPEPTSSPAAPARTTTPTIEPTATPSTPTPAPAAASAPAAAIPQTAAEVAPVVSPAAVVAAPGSASAPVTVFRGAAVPAGRPDGTPQDLPAAVRTATSTGRVTHAVAQNLLTRIALGLAGVLPTAPAGGGPVAPAAPTSALLLAQWALFRRGGSLFNQSPVSRPAQAPSSTGQIVGDLHATDPDGDRLTYTVVSDGAHGHVVVKANGTFTYTPDPAFAKTGGTDSFTVVIRDNDAAAPGPGRYTDLLRGVLSRHHPVLASRLFGPHAVTITVPVTVTPSGPNTPPVVSPTPPASTVDRGTGAVRGSLGVQDPDGDRLTYTVQQPTGIGTVVVDQTTGTYTFTPDAAARRAAAGSVGGDFVTFTVFVSDGQGDPLPVTVTAAIDPGPAEVVAGLPVGVGTSTMYASPDGRRIYAVGQAGTPTVLPFASARAAVQRAAVAPTGSTISIIDAGSNTLISTVTLPGNADQFVFSPDGSHAFVTSWESYVRDSPATITVIDVATDTVVATIEAENLRGDLYFSPDGRTAYVTDRTNGEVGVITVLDLDDDTTTTIEVPYPQQLFFSPDGRRAYNASASERRTYIIDTSDHHVIGSVPGYGPVRFDPDGTHAYVVDYRSENSSVTVIDIGTDSVAAIVPLGSYPSGIQFGSGGRFAYVSDNTWGGDETLTIIDTSDFSSRTVDLGEDPSELQLAPAGNRGYIVDRDAGTVTIIDTENGVVLDAVDTTDEEYSYIREWAFSPDGSRFYISDSGRTTIINTVDDTVTVVPGDGRLGFTPDGSAAYLLGYDNDGGTTLQLVSTADDSVRAFSVPVSYASSVFFTADATRAYFQTYDGVLTVLDTTTGTTRAVPVGQPVYQPQFSPDGLQLYVGGYDAYGGPYGSPSGEASVVVLSTVDDTVWTVPLREYPSYVTFSPDGTHAYVTSERGPTGTKVTVIDRSDGSYTTFDTSPYASDVAFSPDGRFGYITGNEEVTFIDLSDGARSVVPASVVNGVRFSADGRHAYILDSRGGTAVVVALDEPAGTTDPQTQV
ncbi:Ig-like domain-containing protein [Actinomycetospora termitidis]|uniref:Ig-like domain-containing protein n=1 Tax=Actinomycetospora termitidis TaxID=3053470 RepID=A0ABT7ME89_9PSEU|nr:Ig-like domain-containing protein [Actinomycetospora sp. Odt1-22]MDL5158980.1 Ig-like domain-containing protein [Actinomycetospora sp. Odt1-22]